MLVVDTSAFISLAVGDVLELTLEEFVIVTTHTVIDELEQTADYDDPHGRGASTALALVDKAELIETDGQDLVTSRIDVGEASCVVAVQEVGAAFLITDDYRALPELRHLIDAEVALSPIVLRALVKRNVLSEEEATTALRTIADRRDWLGAPIYRYARQLFD
ncbi:hypothetical protein [Halegenticoccus tardaugens]|uniref:hypothetical protein n=1 Tax=Halegenticoccus tardaugens TaxID=2071624 RepID=UPI00100BCB55|nr:hypothetical protein [Halegenticoccus tardaugens]